MVLPAHVEVTEDGSLSNSVARHGVHGDVPDVPVASSQNYLVSISDGTSVARSDSDMRIIQVICYGCT